MSFPEELAKLAELHKTGALTAEEYTAAKKRLLEPATTDSVLIPDGIPLAESIPSEPLSAPSPWDTAVIQPHDGMSDAYWKARYRGALSLVPIVLLVATLFSCCGSVSMAAEGASDRQANRSTMERGAMVFTAVAWFLSIVGLFAWSLRDPFHAGIGAIVVILTVGVLSTLFTAFDLADEMDTPVTRESKAVSGALLFGWIIRLIVVGVLIWGVVDARHVYRYRRSRN
jgi:hypothetical protein